ncbi:MAG: hypothetical protein RIR00_1754 [Pseudomonadota bacterium]
MDYRLEPHKKVNAELRARIQESAVILAFVSPSYLESEWCMLEMATFIEEVGGGDCADRVFMVEVLPTERASWHKALRDLSPVKCWGADLQNPEAKTLGWPVPDVRADRNYWGKVNDLASILARQLQLLPEKPPVPVAAKPENQESQTKTNAVAPSGAESHLSILITADTPDQSLAVQTQAVLADLEVDAYLAPAMSQNQNPGEYRKAVEAQLLENHGVIVVYGETPPTWVQAKFGEVKKVLALQRKGTWAGLLEGPPEGKLHHGLPPRGLMVMNCKAGVDQAELSRFIAALRQGANGQAGARHV